MKKLLFLIFSLFVFTGCTLFTKKDTPSPASVPSPDASEVIKDTLIGIDPQDQMAPKSQQGKFLSFLGGYSQLPTTLNDGGLYAAYVKDPSNKASLVDQLASWLTTFGSAEGKQQIELKHARVDVPGSRLVIPGGADLMSHIQGVKVVISTAGDDLIVDAQTAHATNESFLIFKDSLSDNYLIKDPYNWYGDVIYMIPQKTLSLIWLRWGSDHEGFALSYHSWAYTTAIESVYNYNYYDTNTALSTNLLDSVQILPTHTPFTLTPNRPWGPIHVFQIDLSDDTSKQDELLASLKTHLNQKGVDDLRTQLAPRGAIAGLRELTANQSGNREFTTSTASKQALLMIEPTMVNMMVFGVADAFTADFTQQVIDEQNYYYYGSPYSASIITNFTLDDTSLFEALEKALGSWIVSYPRNGSFSFKIQPKQHYKHDIMVKSIYGHTLTVPIDLYLESIDKRTTIQHILANNTMSILPKSGTFSDVLVQYENIDTFPINFQSCTVRDTPDMQATNKGQWLENYLFDCQGQITKTTLTTSWFVYWKAYRQAVVLPTELQSASAFRVYFTDINGALQEHYFLKSDIGLWTKLAKNQLYVRWFTFEDGKPIQEGTLTVTSLWGREIAKKSITWPVTILDVPEFIPAEGYDYNQSWKEESFIVHIQSRYQETFMPVHRRGEERVYGSAWKIDERGNFQSQPRKINSKLSASEVNSSNQSLETRWSDEPLKIYGFSDRGLYKAGDSVNLAGFVRDVSRLNDIAFLKWGNVSITLQNFSAGEPVLLDTLALDDFGWFDASWKIPASVPLGEYSVTYNYTNTTGELYASYSHNIRIEEYQKPTFFADMLQQEKDWNRVLTMTPTYYFGTPLKAYDAQIIWSLQGKDICRYCRREQPEKYYFNHIFDQPEATWGNVRVYQQQGSTEIPLYALAWNNRGYATTLKIEATIRDTMTDETQFITKYIDYTPEVELWLEGQPYMYLYEEGDKWIPDHALHGVMRKWSDKVKELRYGIYYRSYDQEFQQWVDGNLYYVASQGVNYLEVGSGVLKDTTNFTIPSGFITKPGQYFVRVYAVDATDTVISEVQKRIERYQFSQDNDGLLGSVPNTYTLKVDIPHKTYELGDTIPLNILPYQKWAHVVITVERGNRLIEHKVIELDWSAPTLEVTREYAPNVIISVMQLQPTALNTSARKEPRFFAWYVEAEVSVAMHEMNISITTNKDTYEPGDEVVMKIKTTDNKGKPLDAKVSLGVIDLALVDFYHLVKEPIPYFFSKRGTSVFTYTNMKLLYQSLKAFANAGSKWGWGGWGKAMFSYIRKDLKDLAWWSGSVITTNGEATVRFIAPANLTTRYIDALGISKDTHLGTTSDTFVVKKDLIIEANPPLFVTPGDTLQVPLKVISTKKWNIKGSAYLQNAFWDRREIGDFNVAPGEKTFVTLSIPVERATSPYVILGVSGKVGSVADGVEHIIPLRSDGLLIKEAQALMGSTGTYMLTLPATLSQQGTISFSQLPTSLLDPVFTYLAHYPYGCTEQLMSSIAPLVLSKNRIENFGYTSPLLSWNTILQPDGKINIDQAISDGLSKLLTHQRSDGLFDYRQGQQFTEVTSYQYLLSVYVYGWLRMAATLPGYQKLLATPLERLSAGLETYRDVNKTGYLRYLYQKSVAGTTLSPEEMSAVGSLVKDADQDYGSLLRYLIAVNQKDTDAIATWSPRVHLPTNRDQWNEMSTYLNPVTAHAMLLRGRMQDPTSTDAQKYTALQAVLAMRGDDGLRGWSTQNNVQALQALSTAMQTWTTKPNIACTLTVDGQQHSFDLHLKDVYVLPFTPQPGKVDINRSCDSLVMGDLQVSYMPKELTDVLSTGAGVQGMQQSFIDGDVAIGETKNVAASFTTTLPGEQVAVEIFVPADTKILEAITAKNDDQQDPYGWYAPAFPFAISDSHCMPTHWESRFDRLFLYYDRLEPGSCDFSFPVLQAYSGTATTMPFRIYEMYKGKLNGRKMILSQ